MRAARRILPQCLSINDAGGVGCGIFIPSLGKISHYSLGEDGCICTAELTAIMMALSHVLALPLQLYQLLVCTGSKAALQSIQLNNNSARPDIVLEIKLIIHN